MKKIHYNILVLILLFSTSTDAQPTDCISDRYQQEVFPNLQITRDITFSVDAPNVAGFNQDLELDFFEPAPTDEYLPKRPLVIMLFGGAFLAGSKNADDIQEMCERLTRHGYVCAAPEYRLDNIFSIGTSQDRVERAMFRCAQDAHAAIRYLVEDPNGVGYNIDPNHIYIGGASAGAIGALHAAYMDNSERLPSMTSIGTLESVGNTYNPTFSFAGVLDYWGAILNDAMIDASDNIPMLIVHGDNDTTVPYGTAQPYNGAFPSAPLMYGAVPMDARLGLQGIDRDFYTYVGEGHTVWGGITTFPNQYWDPIFLQTRDFLYDRTLQFDSPAPMGALTACVGDTETYGVPANVDSYFCWNVINGTVVSTNNEQITVQWGAAGMGQLELTEANCLDVIGTAQVIDVVIETCSCAAMDLTFNFDGNPNQTSWEILDANGLPVSTGGAYTGATGGSSLIETACLPDGCYDLVVYDSANDGMCPRRTATVLTGINLASLGLGGIFSGAPRVAQACGNYTLTDALGNVVATGGGRFGTAEMNSFCIIGGVVQLQESNEIYERLASDFAVNLNVYPNPANEQITIEHNIFSDDNIQVNIMDTNGRMLKQHSTGSSSDQAISLDVSDLPAGIYFVRMTVNDGVFVEKFVKK